MLPWYTVPGHACVLQDISCPSVSEPGHVPSPFDGGGLSQRPIKAKFYVEPPWVGGTKVCSRHLGHMTKLSATAIYVFSGTGVPISTKLGM